MDRIPLGPFEIFERIGRGGMGDVYRGCHVAQGVDVAVKVITSKRAQKTTYIKAFRNEVHSMARLDHPGVVMVFDLGEISLDAATRSRGRLQVGSPFVAMELATHGTLGRVRQGLHWKRLKAILYSVLDALAHAHARGVIHRDLKPGNVLLSVQGQQKSPQIKLVDFGLANAMDATDRDPLEAPSSENLHFKIAGTPRYMAPEQIEGQWRDQGPWTDLYALGCLTHYLVNGIPPFSGTLEDILAGHLYKSPPPLEPDFAVPHGFARWVEQLLQKRPGERFRRAADAAYELLRLDTALEGEEFELFASGLDEITNQSWTESELLALSKSNPSGPSRPNTPQSEEVFHTAHAFTETALEINIRNRESQPPNRLAAHDVVVPIPNTWRRHNSTATSSMRLIGAGLGLYGVRSTPLIAREKERDEAWESLKQVHQDGRPRVLAMRGAAGNGKSRLAEWICERAHETGAATIFKARHSRTQGLYEALRRMIMTAIRGHGMNRATLERRIRDKFLERGSVDLRDCQVLARLCVPEEDDDLSFLSPTERFRAIRSFLELEAVERPIIVWFDDVQWGGEALEFISYCMRLGVHLPVLFVLTVRDEALTDDMLEARLLKRLIDLDQNKEVRIGALPSDDHERLVRELLSLEGELASEVAERTDGNPLFAVQLVGDWVQRGVLEVKPEGFCLRKGETAPVPRSIRQVWRERITRVVQTYDAPGLARMALEAAAVLGDEIDLTEWRLVCQKFGVHQLPEDLVERLLESQMALRNEVGWTFSHGMLRETLLQEIQDTGQTSRYQRACVSTLQNIYPPSRREIRERVAMHQLAAGDYSRALEPLLDAASWRIQTCDFDQSRKLLDRHKETMQRLKIPESDERWGQNWLLRITAMLAQGLIREAEEYVERGYELAEEFDWNCRATFVMRRASIARKRGEIDEAEYYYRLAHDLFREIDLHGVGRCLYGIGEIYIFRGDFEAAEEFLSNAEQYIPKATEPYALLLSGQATIHTRRGEHAEARELLLEAVRTFEQLGNRNGMAGVLNSIGELERTCENWEAASSAYEQAREILISIDSRSVVIPRLNMGLMKIASENWREARRILEEGLEELLRNNQKGPLGLLYVALLPCAAATRDWDAWDDYLKRAKVALEDSEAADSDILAHAELAARMAMRGGQPLRAQQADDLAYLQRQSLRVV